MAPTYKFADGEEVEIKNKNRFTIFLPQGHHGMGDLEKWRDWFLSRGINACLVEVKGKGFAVYRNGLISLKETCGKARMSKVDASCTPRRRGRPRKQVVSAQ